MFESLKEKGRHILSLASGAVVASALSLALTTILANSMGSSLFGLYATIVGLASLFRYIINGQSWQWVSKYIIESENKFQVVSVVHIGYVVDFIISAIASLMFLGYLKFFGNAILPNDGVTDIAYLMFIPLLFNLENTSLGIINAYKKFRYQTYWMVISAIAKFSVVSLVVYHFSMLDSLQFLYLVVISVVVVDLFGILIIVVLSQVILRKLDIKLWCLGSSSGYVSVFKKLRGFMCLGAIYSAIKSTVREGDVVVLSHLATPSDVGIYKLAKSYGMLGFLLITPITQVAYPYILKLFNSNSHKKLKKIAGYSYAFSLAVALVVIVPLYLASEVVLGYIFSDEYKNLSLVFLIFIGAVLVQFVGFVNTPILMAYNKVDLMIFTTLFAVGIYMMVMFNMAGDSSVYAAGSYMVFSLSWLLLSSFFVKKTVNSKIEM